MSVSIYSFYNNKGGVGKTTLCCNVAALYAENHPETQVLVIDMCPQANASQFFLGGGREGQNANQALQSSSTRKNIVGFIDWLLRGHSNFTRPNTGYGVPVKPSNHNIADNVFLIAGDSFLESLSLALNYAVINPANTNAWMEFMTAIRRLSEAEFNEMKYENLTVFIDCNPSFSIYTQMALVSSDNLIIPMMADYSSAEGIRSIFTMLYGVYPSAALQKYANNVITFNKQMKTFDLQAPRIFELVFNNYTANLGVAAAYEAIKRELLDVCFEHYAAFPDHFYPTEEPLEERDDFEDVFVSQVKDFHTAGRVSASLGIPIHRLPQRTRYTMPDGTEVTTSTIRYEEALEQVTRLAKKIY